MDEEINKRIEKAKLEEQTSTVDESRRLFINDDGQPCLEEKRNFTRVFRMPLVFDGELLVNEKVAFQGKLYLGDNGELYRPMDPYNNGTIELQEFVPGLLEVEEKEVDQAAEQLVEKIKENIKEKKEKGGDEQIDSGLSPKKDK